ncbi:hypothetical protein JOB18_033613 [Solea senegalensis]|uniref:Uncharacterized protein n=1 Tax=Solea senegalensis TaxID=28829 RepID=A0AAV6SS22_SOLSE|nr:hypothetical protein JOB18_033613 [Solea senegalensis]
MDKREVRRSFSPPSLVVISGKPGPEESAERPTDGQETHPETKTVRSKRFERRSNFQRQRARCGLRGALELPGPERWL